MQLYVIYLINLIPNKTTEFRAKIFFRKVILSLIKSYANSEYFLHINSIRLFIFKALSMI